MNGNKTHWEKLRRLVGGRCRFAGACRLLMMMQLFAMNRIVVGFLQLRGGGSNSGGGGGAAESRRGERQDERRRAKS